MLPSAPVRIRLALHSQFLNYYFFVVLLLMSPIWWCSSFRIVSSFFYMLFNWNMLHREKQKHQCDLSMLCALLLWEPSSGGLGGSGDLSLQKEPKWSSESILSEGQGRSKAKSYLRLCFRLRCFCCNWGLWENAPERTFPLEVCSKIQKDTHAFKEQIITCEQNKEMVYMTVGSNLDNNALPFIHCQRDRKKFWMNPVSKKFKKKKKTRSFECGTGNLAL